MPDNASRRPGHTRPRERRDTLPAAATVAESVRYRVRGEATRMGPCARGRGSFFRRRDIRRVVADPAMR